MARKYGKKAQAKVKGVMRERKRGTLRSGRSGKRVTSRKQAIAIGLSEARRRREGAAEVERAEALDPPAGLPLAQSGRLLGVAVAAALVAQRLGRDALALCRGHLEGPDVGPGTARPRFTRARIDRRFARVRLGHRHLHRHGRAPAAGVPEARRLLRL